MLEHGGRLLRAARRYGIPPHRWLDLSTGVSPHSWLDERPVHLPRSAWVRLPEDEDGLAEAAREYYGNDALPVAGSQAAIQCLPRLRPPTRVGIISPGYNEHAHAWRRAGHDVIALPPSVCLEAADEVDVLVLIHPNNPTGTRFDRTRLLDVHGTLARRGGWLVVDEAFMDATPEASLAAETHRPGLIVLRSLGKFFGLAGARVGFMLACTELRDALADMLGPWTIPGPSRQIAMQALRDVDWQRMQRARIRADGERLAGLLADAGLKPDGGCALFQWVCTDQAASLHDALARRGILTRLFEDPPSLRLGLPGPEADWNRLRQALNEIRSGNGE